jgi:hypothetical protein
MGVGPDFGPIKTGARISAGAMRNREGDTGVEPGTYLPIPPPQRLEAGKDLTKCRHGTTV